MVKTPDPEKIKDDIAWLEDDILSCQAAARNASLAEIAEYLGRISANKAEIARLRKLLGETA